MARNLERVLTARLRDARFFWDADRGQPLERHRERLATVAFHKGLGHASATRPSGSSRWRAGLPPRCSAGPSAADAGGAGGAAVQGRPGHQHGARADRAAGHDRRHLRPRGRRARGGVEGDLPPLPADGGRGRRRRRRATELGDAAVPWAAVSLADKLDTRGRACSSPGERPTGSRDPYGIRRAAQGLVRMLADLPELTGVDVGDPAGRAGRAQALARLPAADGPAEAAQALWAFLRRPRPQRVRAARRRRPQRAGRDPRRARGAGAADGAAPARRAARVHRDRRLHAARRALQARPQHRPHMLDDASSTARRAPGRRSRALTEPAELALRRGDRRRRAGDRRPRSPPATATARRSPRRPRSARPSPGSSTTSW